MIEKNKKKEDRNVYEIVSQFQSGISQLQLHSELITISYQNLYI